MKIALLLPITLSELQPLFPGQKLTGGYPYSLFVPLVYYYLSLGHEIVICTEDHSSMNSSVYYGDNITIFCAGTLPKAKLRAAFNFKYEINQMVRFLRNNQCDIYHAHWLYDFAQAAMKVDEKKTLITIHDWPDHINKSYNDFYWNKKLNMGRKTLEQGSLFTTVSPYMIKNMEKNYPNKKVNLIPNLISTKSKINYEKKFREEKQIIVAISNGFSNLKNIKNLILAFEIVRKKSPDCTLKLIGRELGIGEAAESWACNFSSTDGIEFIGSIKNSGVIEELNKADLFVHPSREESFGMVILEAMSNCVPVIGGEESGAVPWILENGKCGELVDVESPEKIANSIINLLQNTNKLKELSLLGYTRAKMFSVEKIGQMYLDIYKRVISSTIKIKT